MKRLRFSRPWAVVSVLAIAIVVAGGAYAGHQDANVVSYTGCLNTSGDSAGNVLKIKAGDSPLKPCSSGQVQFHFSGGDITAVRTPGGSGLTGGAENGAVTLGLTDQQKLPSCSQGQIPEWNGSAWACGADDDTKYTAGTGLDLSGGNQFSILQRYQLPQSCSNGQVAKSNGSGSWNCANDENNGFPPAFAAGESDDIVQGTVIKKTLPAGTYVIFAKVEAVNTDEDDSVFVNCLLKVGQATLDTVTNHLIDEATTESSTHEVIVLQTDLSIGEDTLVRVDCNASESTVKFRERKLTAIRVASVS